MLLGAVEFQWGPSEQTSNLGPNPKKLWILPSNSLNSDAFKPRLYANNSNFVKVTLNPLPSTIYHLNDNRALSAAEMICALYLPPLCLCCASGRSLAPQGDGSYRGLGPQSLLLTSCSAMTAAMSPFVWRQVQVGSGTIYLNNNQVASKC